MSEEIRDAGSPEELARRWYRATSDADAQALEALVTPDFRARYPAFEADLRSLQGMLAAYRVGFPDLTVEPEILHACPDAMTVWATTRGTHEGPFMDHPPTDRSFEAAGLDHFTLRDGRIAALASLFDTESMLRQLGLRGGGG